MEVRHLVVVNGSYGVGKSSVLDHLADRMASAGRPFSLFDVDWFHRSWPVAADDPDNVVVEARNLAAVWANYRAAGPRQPFLAGVLRTPADRSRLSDAFWLSVWSVRLEAAPEVAEARLRGRYRAEQASTLDRHLERHLALARELAEADLDHAVIATDELTPAQVADEVLRLSGVLRA